MSHKKKNTQIYEILQFFGTNNENKKKKRLIKDKIGRAHV